MEKEFIPYEQALALKELGIACHLLINPGPFLGKLKAQLKKVGCHGDP